MNMFFLEFFLLTLLILYSYIITNSKNIWRSLLCINFAMAFIFYARHLINTKTNEGINLATFFYIKESNLSEITLVFHAADLLIFSIQIAVFFIFFIFLFKKSPIGLFNTSKVFQIISTSLFLLFLSLQSSFSNDILTIAQSSGFLKKDHIGIENVVKKTSKIKTIDIKNKKNLIVLYTESLETYFFDEKKSPLLLPKTNKIMESGVVFNRINQSPMASWTIAGMIASQCGSPLSSMKKRNHDFELANVSRSNPCLFNLIKNTHYLAYLGGADVDFAGKSNFYKLQGFDEVIGLGQLNSIELPKSKWGLYDEHLFEIAKNKIINLRRTGKPFAFVALTLDTHPPEGFPSPFCKKNNIRYWNNENNHMNTIHCSDYLIADFLESIIENNIHDSTIVMLSDHLMMHSQASQFIFDEHQKRYNHMVIWDENLKPKTIRRESSQFDIGSTILHVFSGEEIDIGFGRSLLSKSKNLTEVFGEEKFNDSIDAWRFSRLSADDF